MREKERSLEIDRPREQGKHFLSEKKINQTKVVNYTGKEDIRFRWLVQCKNLSRINE